MGFRHDEHVEHVEKAESPENPEELADCVVRLEERQKNWDLPRVRDPVESFEVAIAPRDDAMVLATLPLPSA